MARILFVSRIRGTNQPSLSIELLSSYLKSKGHQTELIADFDDANFKNRLIRRIEEYSPSLIGFSVLTLEFTWAVDTAKLIKNICAIPIVFGNIHPTALPELTLSEGCIDFVIRGEGEYALLSLLECLENGSSYHSIQNLCYLEKHDKTVCICNPMGDLINDLDLLPFPDKSITLKEAPFYDDIYYTMTERGCVKSCTFCFNHLLKKFYLGKGIWCRRRTVGNVLEELMIAKKQRYKFIQFGDDSFVSNPEWLKEFASLYKKNINMPFQINACADHVTEDVVKILAQIGCIKVKIGVQTTSDSLRRDICGIFTNKEKIVQAVDCLKRNSIFVGVDTMFNLPTQNESDVIRDLEFYNKIRPDGIDDFNLIYYPQTNIVNIALQKNVLTNTDIDKINIQGLHADHIKDRKLLLFIPIIPNLPAYIVALIVKYKFWKKIPFAFYELYNRSFGRVSLKHIFKRGFVYLLHIRRILRYKILISKLKCS